MEISIASFVHSQIKGTGAAFITHLSRYKGELARLHLALFYYHGIYYQWPKRLTGEAR